MKYIKTLLLVLLLYLHVRCDTQNTTIENETELNSITVNVFSYIAFVSLTYERMIHLNENNYISLMTGIGENEEFVICVFGNCDPDNYSAICNAVEFITVNNKMRMRVGAGGTALLNVENDLLYYRPYLLAGLRFTGDNGFTWGVNTLFTDYSHPSHVIALPIGFSAGLSF